MIAHITPTIMDGIVVRWNPSPEQTAEISASRNAVAIDGYWMLRTEHARVEFDRTVSLAWEMYRLLSKADSRGPFLRAEMADVQAWLAERGVTVVDRRFGEPLVEAMRRADGKEDSRG